MAKIFKNAVISKETIYLGLLPENITLDFLPEPQKDTEQTLEHAWQSAYAQGLTDGAAQERALLHEQLTAFNALLSTIPEAISTNRQQLSSEIADIVLLITSKFFINQQQDKDSIIHQINQILTQLNDKQNLEIALHPHDLAVIQQNEIATHKNIRLLPDDTLRLGGCIISSDHGVFDAGIERQMDNLKQVLLQMRTRND